MPSCHGSVLIMAYRFSNILHRDAVAKNIREFKLYEISNTWNAVTNEAKLFLSSLLSYDPMVSHKRLSSLNMSVLSDNIYTFFFLLFNMHSYADKTFLLPSTFLSVGC